MEITLRLKPLPTSANKALWPRTQLSVWLGRAVEGPKYDTEEALWAALFHFPEPRALPQAAVHAAAYALDGAYPTWVHADPVHIVAGSHQAILQEKVLLSDTETLELLLDINQFLLSDEMVLFAPLPGEWLLNTARPATIESLATEKMLGRNIGPDLPVGPDSSYWRRLFTELQMLLHYHPVNQARRKAGLTTIEALWFWGAGNACRLHEAPWSQVFTYHENGQGLAHFADIPCTAPPDDGAQLLSTLLPEEQYFIDLTSLPDLATLETAWLRPLTQCLSAGKLHQLTLLIDKRTFVVTARTLKAWWRRKIAYQDFLPDDQTD